MDKTIKMDTLRELYRVDNKYWKTGDRDILDKRMALTKEVDKRFDHEIGSITRMVTQKHYPVKKLAEVLRVLGYEVEEEEGEKNETD